MRMMRGCRERVEVVVEVVVVVEVEVVLVAVWRVVVMC
jgi:hypothetical protein